LIRSQHLRVIDRTMMMHLPPIPICPSPEYVGGANLKTHRRPARIERTSFASDYVEQIVSLVQRVVVDSNRYVPSLLNSFS
jgi:hypothetical protein